MTDPSLEVMATAASESPVSSLFQSALEGLLGVDARGFCVFANRAALKILAATGEMVVGRGLHKILHGSSHEETLCPVMEAAAAGMSQSGSDEFVRHNGGTASVEYSLTPATEEGVVRGAILHFKDVTQRNRTRQDVSFYTQLLEAVEQAVIALDIYGNVSYWNDHAAKLFGVEAADAGGRSILTLIPSEDLQKQAADITDGLLRGIPWIGELTIEPFHRSAFPVNATISPILDGARSIVGFVAIAKDISRRKQTEMTIREMNDRLTQTLERITDGCYSLDRQWNFTFVNQEGERILRRDSLVGKNIREVFPDADALEFYQAYEQALELQTPTRVQAYYCPDSRWYEARAFPSPEGLTVYFRDITQEKLAEQALIRSNERFEEATRATQDLIFEVDLVTHLVWRSEALRARFGYLPSDVGESVEWGFRQIHPADRQKIRVSFEKCLASSDTSWSAEYRLRRANGNYAHVLTRATVARDDSGRGVRMVGATSDVSERKAAEQRLERSRKKMQALSRRLLVVQEAERTRIAREIHDQLGQSLTALKFAVRSLTGEGCDLAEKSREMNALLDDTIVMVRRIARELRPPVLDNLGVVAAVQREVDDFQKRTGLECRVSVSETFPKVDQPRSVAMFRVLQEALTNIARYSGATRVDVSLYETARTLCLRIHDDGCGISRSQPDASSLGLLGMQERASLVKGTFNVERHRAGGTVVELTIPRPRLRRPAGPS